MKFNVILIKFYEKYIKFHKFNVHIHLIWVTTVLNFQLNHSVLLISFITVSFIYM